MCRPQKLPFVCYWSSKTWNPLRSQKLQNISSDQKTNLKWHPTPTSLRTASWRRMQIWFAAEESWSVENRLASFCWGRGRKVASGEARPTDNCANFQAMFVLFFSRWCFQASCLKEFVFVCFPEWWKLLIRGGTHSICTIYIITCTDLDRHYIIAYNYSMLLRHYLGKILNAGFN